MARMPLCFLVVMMFSVTALAEISPYEQWVITNWLSEDTRGDLNNDGFCNFGDFALAAQRDVGVLVIWGRTRQIAEESLAVAIDEAIFENRMQLATSYRECLDRMLAEDAAGGGE